VAEKYDDLAIKQWDVPLEQVVYELGLDPDPKDKHKWKHENHQHHWQQVL